MDKKENKLNEANIEEYKNNDSLSVCTENRMLIKENNELRNEFKKLEIENKVLKKQLREISEYCKCILKCF